MQIIDVCADDRDVLALSVIRSLMAGYVTGDVACWEMAHVGAERVVGAESAALLVASLTTLVRALRSHHDADWHFMPVTCCRVTRDEQAVLAVLKTLRESGGVPALPPGLDLIRPEGLPSVLRAAHMAARVLDGLGPIRPDADGSGRHGALH